MSIRSLLSSWLHPVRTDPACAALVDNAVRRIGPALASAGGVERRLAPALMQAQGYCQSLVEQLPEPLLLDRSAIADNALVHALFPSVEELRTVIGGSESVRTLIQSGQLDGRDEIMALLVARRQMRHVLGVELEGGTLQHDVAQTLLSFSGQVLAQAAVDQASAQELLRDAALASLLETFARHVQAIRDDMLSLERERGMERTYLELLRGQSKPDRVEAHLREIDALNMRLRQDLEALQPDRVVETLADFLAAPHNALRLEHSTLHVFRNGAVVEPQVERVCDADQLELDELISRDRRRHVLVPVRLPLDFVQDCVAAQAEVLARWIHI